MTYIRKLYDQWLDFKHIRNNNAYYCDRDKKWLTMKDREKMIDCLFEYIRTQTKPKEK